MVSEMQCPNCQHENREGAKFCIKCGRNLESVCPQCGKDLPAEAVFCDGCGHDLTQAAPSQPTTPPPTKNPTSFANGRYEVKEFLGEGGKKKVYKAYDTLLDRDVALALIKTEGLDEDSRTRITREAQAMGRLGAHPNVVTVFDLGEDNGQPFIVSEVLGGGDVEGLIQKASDHRLPMEQVIEIGQSVCEGLEFAHNKGIIHRDLKPSNIYLTDDGVVKIGDFGLALVDDRTRLTQEGMMIGTVSYLPPEQAVGGEVTAKSDLYSLGAMLYEMVTGRPPFLGDDTVAIIGQHLNTPPVSPSWHNPDIPPVLETLILRLLEKNAAKRSASALEVSLALESIQKGAIEEEPEKEDAQAEKSGPLYRQIFVGRENELSQLKAAFDNALSGEGSLMMVVGEPGIGKTAVTEQLATYATMRGGLTLVGHCYEEGSLSLPYLAFVEAMRTYVLSGEANELRRAMGTGASEVARIVSEVRDKLDVTPREASNPDEDRYRLFQAVTDFLINASEVQPLLIVLEDLHDADKGTLDLLTHITRRKGKGRFLMVGTYRDVEVDRSHPLSSTLADLRRVSSYERVLLRGLNVDEVHRMLSGLSGQDVPWQVSEAVFRQTEGNPLFVQEVLRYAVEDGLIVRESGEWRAVNPDQLIMSIPEGLRDVIGKRLSNLSPECGQLLSMASVMGREFSFEVLQRLADMPEEDLFKALQEAISAAVIEERTLSGAAVIYRFTHAFIRQTLYEEMIAPRRNRLHQQIAQALEEVFASRLKEHAVELAEHFSHSTHPDDLTKAVQYGEMAAQRAIDVFDYGEAVRLWEQTLQVQEVLDPDDKEKQCDLLLDLGEALVYGEKPRRFLDKEASTALSLAEEIEDDLRVSRVCGLAILALIHHGAGPIFATPEAAKWAEIADRSAGQGTIERVRANIAVSMVQYYRRFKDGLSLLGQAVDDAREFGDPETFRQAAAMWLYMASAPKYGKKRMELAEEVAESSRYGVGIHMQLNMISLLINTFLTFGQRDRAEEYERELLALGEQVNAPGYQIEEFNIRHAYYDGKLDDAVEISRRLEALGKETERSGFVGTIVNVSGLRPRLYLGTAENFMKRILMERPDFEVRPFYLVLLGKTDEATELLKQTVLAYPKIGYAENEAPDYITIMLLETAMLLENHEAIEILLRRFEGNIGSTTGIYFPTCISRHLGAGTAMLGRYDEAKGHYLDAIKVAEDMRFRPELALTRFQFAELQLEHYPDEKSEAIEHLKFAIDEFTEMKMQPSLEKAEEMKEKINI